MFLLYLDPSGTPDPSDNSSTYCFLGLCLHETDWLDLEEQVREVKAPHLHQDRDLELHAKELCSWIRAQDEIEGFSSLSFADRRREVQKRHEAKLVAADSSRRARKKKKYRLLEPYAHLTRSERRRLFETSLDFLGKQGRARLFCEIVDKDHFFSSSESDPERIVRHTLAQIVSRFDAFLKRSNRRSRKGRRGPDKGLLIMDREPTREQTIRGIVDEYRQKGHPWGTVRHVIETPFFVDSRASSGVQLADLCAYAVRRYVERSDRDGSHEEADFSRIFGRFDRDRGKLHGLRHYCARGSCTCRICRARQHGVG